MATVAKIPKDPSPNVMHGIPRSQHTPYGQEGGYSFTELLMCIKPCNISKNWKPYPGFISAYEEQKQPFGSIQTLPFHFYSVCHFTAHTHA